MTQTTVSIITFLKQLFNRISAQKPELQVDYIFNSKLIYIVDSI